MTEVTVELRSVDGTEAAMGWAGSHTVVVDRPDGRAGGQGLGFNGAQLLGLALGGCFCNDLRYAAYELGVALGEITVSVTLELGETPLITKSARLFVQCTTRDRTDPAVVIEKAKSICMVGHSLQRGLPVSFERVGH